MGMNGISGGNNVKVLVEWTALESVGKRSGEAGEWEIGEDENPQPRGSEEGKGPNSAGNKLRAQSEK